MEGKKYLATIQFDCNDSDYVYGLQVINEEQKETIERNWHKGVIFGSYDFGGGNTRRVDDCVSLEEINDNDYEVLKKLYLLNFGEGNAYWIKELDDADEHVGDDDE